MISTCVSFIVGHFYTYQLSLKRFFALTVLRYFFSHKLLNSLHLGYFQNLLYSLRDKHICFISYRRLLHISRQSKEILLAHCLIDISCTIKYGKSLHLVYVLKETLSFPFSGLSDVRRRNLFYS